jgi:hypothetical protein
MTLYLSILGFDVCFGLFLVWCSHGYTPKGRTLRHWIYMSLTLVDNSKIVSGRQLPCMVRLSFHCLVVESHDFFFLGLV